MVRWIAGLLYIVLVVVLLTGWGLVGVYGHGWYDPECCSDRVCQPIAYAPRPLPGGSFLLDTGEVVEPGRVKWSRDEHYHLCRSPNTGQIYCLYVPPSSS